jgi:hypothetical protein
MTTEEYFCTLVNESRDPESGKYLAVSFLDDYVFRPKSLESVNLYEFTMWYFRKKYDSVAASKLQFSITTLCTRRIVWVKYMLTLFQ